MSAAIAAVGSIQISVSGPGPGYRWVESLYGDELCVLDNMDREGLLGLLDGIDADEPIWWSEIDGRAIRAQELEERIREGAR